jgi:hypothetical protein
MGKSSFSPTLMLLALSMVELVIEIDHHFVIFQRSRRTQNDLRLGACCS